MTFSFYVNAFSALLALPLALRGGVETPQTAQMLFWLNIGYLALVSTAFATTVYFRASLRLGPHRAASFILLVPVLAPLLSWIFLGEIPETTTVVGAPFAIAAVYLVNRGSASSASS